MVLSFRQAIKCLEAICQSEAFLPEVQVKARLRVSALLLEYTDNYDEAKIHLERTQLVLKRMPQSKTTLFWLQVKSGLGLVHEKLQGGTSRLQKQELTKGLEIALKDKTTLYEEELASV